MQRIKALSCALPNDRKPACSGQVFIGLFFDGTGNNKHEDYDKLSPEKRKHSNIVRLYQAYPDEVRRGYIAEYVPGVGTPFPAIGDKGSSAGKAFAERGEERILWGFTRLLNAPYRYVFGAPLISDAQAYAFAAECSSSSVAYMRRNALRNWQIVLQNKLKGTKPVVEQINLSVFGFSRGAAQARAFVNWLFEVCKQEGGAWTFAGIPIRVQFLGLFDTVASVGLSNISDSGTLAGHQSWADNNLQVHPAVEQCVHFVAGHEVRACFPLDSARTKTAYPGNVREVIYPGAHSDLGGGYPPGAFGVSPTQNSFMCIIPGAQMYKEALKAGVPLRSWSELDPALQESLTPSSDLVNDFNNYLRDAKLVGASVEELHKHHMGLYFSYRFKHRASFEKTSPYVEASTADKPFLQVTQATLLERLRELGQGDPADPDFNPAAAGTICDNMLRASGLSRTTKEDRLIEVAKQIDVKALTPAMEKLLGRYVHDSMAGFAKDKVNEYKFNGIGIVKFRSIFAGND